MVSSSGDTALPVTKYVAINNYAALESNMFANNFKKKENNPQAGEILWGNQVGGLKGFFSTVKMAVINSVEPGKKELFSVSSTIVQSSY